MQKALLVIVGPTAIGKTAAAIAIARKFSSEIISADSRQVYKELKIGTARPEANEQGGIPHHLLGHISIEKNYSVADFVQDAETCLNVLFNQHDMVVLAGGSGLYIDALCNGMDDLPESNPNIKKALNETLSDEGIEKLQELLFQLDPEYYKQIDLNNPHRLIRAIEVCKISGKKYSELRSGRKKFQPFRIVKIGLHLPREVLYQRINERVLQMMQAGLLDEVKQLVPYRNLKALKTVGYSELFDFLGGTTTLETAIQLIQQNTRRYAKRQLTWFRKDPDIHWVEAGGVEFMAEVEKCLQL